VARLEVRNLRPAEIARDLVKEMDGREVDGGVDGDGWTVRFVEGEPAAVGPRFRVPVLFIDISGEREAELTAFVRRKTMRGGG
jgi:hypothetical protein